MPQVNIFFTFMIFLMIISSGLGYLYIVNEKGVVHKLLEDAEFFINMATEILLTISIMWYTVA